MSLPVDPPQPHPPPSHLPLAVCDRHPCESFTGFCASCLRERLQSLESSTSTTHRNSTSTISSSLKNIFSSNNPNHITSSKPSLSSASSELRRCKSFSFSAPRLSVASSSFEPQRRSCDVRGRSTLWSLFNQDAPAPAPAAADVSRTNDDVAAELRPMKDHLDLESQQQQQQLPKKQSFWLKKFWRRKSKKSKKEEDEGNKCGADSNADPKSFSSARFRETQSEIAVDAFGRRSCDLGPRFSLDAGRISFDDARYSFDEPPRASWDGYSRSLHPRLAPLLSVVEDQPAVVQRSDGLIPVEEDSVVPGGSQQTKDYYSDSSSRSRRRSLDRSNSVKRLSVEMSEARAGSNAAKVSPAGTTEFFRDWSSNSLRDDRSESFESGFRDSKKKSKRWSIWGFIHRRSSSSSGSNNKGGGGDNVGERSFSEAWPEMRVNGYANGRILRSNSNVSSRSSINVGNVGFGSMRKKGLEVNGMGKKRKDEFVLERNRSGRFSPGHVDNGMLRFYLTPMRGSRRGSGISRPNNSYHSFTRSVLGLY